MPTGFSIQQAYSRGFALIWHNKKHFLTIGLLFLLLIILSNVVYLMAVMGYAFVSQYILKSPEIIPTQCNMYAGMGYPWGENLWELIQETIYRKNVSSYTLFIKILDIIRLMVQSLISVITLRMLLDLFYTGTTSIKRMLSIKKYIIPLFITHCMLHFFSKIIFITISYFINLNSFSAETVCNYVVLIILDTFISLPFSFQQFIIVDKNVSILESFKMSYSLTAGHRGKLFVFNIISLIIMVVTLGLGYSLVTAAYVYVYDRLKKENELVTP